MLGFGDEGVSLVRRGHQRRKLEHDCYLLEGLCRQLESFAASQWRIGTRRGRGRRSRLDDGGRWRCGGGGIASVRACRRGASLSVCYRLQFGIEGTASMYFGAVFA